MQRNYYTPFLVTSQGVAANGLTMKLVAYDRPENDSLETIRVYHFDLTSNNAT